MKAYWCDVVITNENTVAVTVGLYDENDNPSRVIYSGEQEIYTGEREFVLSPPIAEEVYV